LTEVYAAQQLQEYAISIDEIVEWNDPTHRTEVEGEVVAIALYDVTSYYGHFSAIPKQRQGVSKDCSNQFNSSQWKWSCSAT
jgi:hypothetical protein